MGSLPFLSLALSHEYVSALTNTGSQDRPGERERYRAPLSALLATGAVSFVAIGTGSAEHDTHHTSPELSASVAASWLADDIVPKAGVLFFATPGQDHPYNLARRVLSFDHLSRGWGGVILGRPSSPHHQPAASPDWTPQADELELLDDAAVIIDQLAQSWPLDSLIADRVTGVYAETDSIVSINFSNRYRVRGPLTLPSSPQQLPIRAWIATSGTDELPPASAASDLVILPVPTDLDDARADSPQSPLTFALDRAANFGRETLQTRLTELVSLGFHGVTVTVDTPEQLESLTLALQGQTGIVTTNPLATTLRERLERPAPVRDIPNAEPAFNVIGKKAQ